MSAAREGKRSIPTGYALLRDPRLNKGSAFPPEERAAFALDGLLPPRVSTLEQQVERVLENYARKGSDLERYIHLASLQDRNETLFYRLLVDRIEEMMPIVYTPTVGEACQQFGHIFRRPRGVYLPIDRRGRLKDLLRNAGRHEVRVIVVTDGERILGLGDQGASGMGIPVGKLALYTACAGIPPGQTVPVLLDVGTDNEAYRSDPLYLGLARPRVRGPEYDDLVAEFVGAVQELWPKALIQFEDFGNANAFRLLQRWRDRVCTFNDDVQGTAAVALAGLVSALRLAGGPLADQRLLFFGAGTAALGIADLTVSAMVEEGATAEEARGRCWLFDSRGLVVRGRDHVDAEKGRYAHAHAPVGELAAAVRALRPTALIGTSTVANAFDRAVIEAMSAAVERPIVFALSNPTSRSECTAADAYRWSGGRAVFASGSPFPPYREGDRTLVPGQGNNAYIFPGVGLGVMLSEARHVTDRMFLAAARALAGAVLDSDLAVGRVYPALGRIREVSAVVATAVAEVAFEDGLARAPRPADLAATVRARMWEPRYESYLR